MSALSIVSRRDWRRIANSCRKSRQKSLVIAERVGKLMGQNTRAAGLFRVQMKEEAGSALIEWSKLDSWRGMGSHERRLLHVAQ